RPVEPGDVAIAAGQLRDLSRRDVDRPQSGVAKVLADDARLPSSLDALLEFLRPWLDGREGQRGAVRRPVERRYRFLVRRQLARLATAHVEQMNLGLPRPRRQERERAAIG